MNSTRNSGAGIPNPLYDMVISLAGLHETEPFQFERGVGEVLVGVTPKTVVICGCAAGMRRFACDRSACEQSSCRV